DCAPKADARNPRPPVAREPGRNDFIPCEIGRFELSDFARVAEIAFSRGVKRLQPKTLFPRQDGSTGVAATPLREAKVLQSAGSGLQIGGLPERLDCARVIARPIGSRAIAEKIRRRIGVGGPKSKEKERKSHNLDSSCSRTFSNSG